MGFERIQVEEPKVKEEKNPSQSPKGIGDGHRDCVCSTSHELSVGQGSVLSLVTSPNP